MNTAKSFTTLISVTELQALQTSDTPMMVFDCTFDLMKPETGQGGPGACAWHVAKGAEIPATTTARAIPARAARPR